MSTGCDRLDSRPLCDGVISFRNAFVGYSNHPDAASKKRLAEMLKEVEVQAHQLRDQLERK